MQITRNQSTAIAVSAAALLLGFASVGRGADALDTLLAMERAMTPGKDMRASLAVTVTNSAGERVHWSGQYYRQSVQKLRQRIALQDPLDVRGIEISFERAADDLDKIRIYLPSVRRVRTLRSDLENETFLGTDFHYDQLGFEDLDLQAHRVVGEADVGGRPCVQVESKHSQRSIYGAITRFVDKVTHLPLRTEYKDLANRVYQVRTIDEWATIGSSVVPTTITMTTVGVGTSTRLRFTQVELDTGFDAALVQGVGGAR